MAHIETRTAKTGTTAYRVKWREGGTRTGAPQTCTLPTEGEARRFAELVGMVGNRMPSADQLRAHGFGWMLPEEDDEPAKPVLTVAELCTTYVNLLADGRAGRHAPADGSIKAYRGNIRNHIADTPLGKTPIDQVELEDVEDWQRQRRAVITPGQRKPIGDNHVGAIRAGVLAPAFKWARSKRSGPLLVGPDPVADALAPRRTEFNRFRLETPAEYTIMLKHAYALGDPEFAELLTFMACTGVRISEALTLSTSAVNLSRATFDVLPQFAKNRKQRTVPVPEIVVEKILAPRVERGGYVFGRPAPWDPDGPRVHPYSRGTATDRWAYLRGRLRPMFGETNISNHSLRHGYVTWLGTMGIERPKLRLAIGHKKKTVTDGYDELTSVDRALIREKITPLVLGVLG
jgi:integrase